MRPATATHLYVVLGQTTPSSVIRVPPNAYAHSVWGSHLEYLKVTFVEFRYSTLAKELAIEVNISLRFAVVTGMKKNSRLKKLFPFATL